MADLTLDDYIRLLAQDPNADIRANAAWMLGRMRDMRTLVPLLARVNDDSALVRARVMESLGVHKTEQVQDALIHGLQDADADVRLMAAQSCGTAEQHGTIANLLTLLQDENAGVRAESAQALGLLFAQEAIPALTNTLIHDTDSTARHYARQSLTQMGGQAVTDAILPNLETFKDDAGILLDLIEVLAHIYAKPAIPALRALLTHSDDGVKEMAKWALGLIDKS
jgi:HEAT repeat protein